MLSLQDDADTNTLFEIVYKTNKIWKILYNKVFSQIIYAGVNIEKLNHRDS